MSARDPDEHFPEHPAVPTPAGRPDGSRDLDGARDLDVVLHGATGFVGRLVAAHLAAHAPRELRIGLSGRSAPRLRQLRSDLGERASRWPLIVADSAEGEALGALARRAHVVASTVGPYVQHGEPLVAVCAAAGTHYVDLTGEVLFVRASIDAHHDTAQVSGARIVHACGFDSVPSDLAVLLLNQRVKVDDAGELGDTTLVVRLRGGLSGGTIDSMSRQVTDVLADHRARQIVHDPYSLTPDRAREPVLRAEQDVVPPFYDERLGGWLAPFLMAPFNTRVVRRSNALQDWAYGRSFRYREVMGMGRGAGGQARSWLMTGALAGAVRALGWAPSRSLLRRLTPAPGEGPSPQQRAQGSFDVRAFTRTTTGADYVATVACGSDPGYDATAVMLAESAIALALGAGLPDRAGVLTPATGIGLALVDRLRTNGFELSARRVRS